MAVLRRVWAKFRSWPTGVQIVVGVVVAVAVFGGSSGDDESTTASGDDEVTSAPAVAGAEPDDSDDLPTRDCIPVPRVRMRGIETGLTVRGGSLRKEAFAVRSDDYKKVWMMAAELDAPGLEGIGDVAVWATNQDPTRTDEYGLTVRANGIAAEFSDWGAAARPGSPMDFQATDDGVAEAIECVESALRS